MAAPQTAPAEDKKKPAADANASTAKSFADMAPPPDMERVDQPSLDGWYKPEKGNGFYGKLLGHFQIPDKKTGIARDVVIVGLLADTAAVDADSGKPITLKRGQYLGVSIRHKLTPIMEYVTNKGTVYAKALEQQSIGGGQTMWLFDLRCSGTKAPPPAPRQLSHDSAAKGGSSGGDDDIPF